MESQHRLPRLRQPQPPLSKVARKPRSLAALSGVPCHRLACTRAGEAVAFLQGAGRTQRACRQGLGLAPVPRVVSWLPPKSRFPPPSPALRTLPSRVLRSGNASARPPARWPWRRCAGSRVVAPQPCAAPRSAASPRSRARRPSRSPTGQRRGPSRRADSDEAHGARQPVKGTEQGFIVVDCSEMQRVPSAGFNFTVYCRERIM
eukprot:scaffold304561_cov31-Tisochrysis_lutea.AAC.3